MPRKQRIHHTEALYHVMLRGNYRQSIFNDDDDRLQICKLLESSIEKFNFKVHLFCLMTNHIHLVIEVGQVPLWKIVQSFASRFSTFKNKKTNQTGHLFQGRYQAKLIQNEKYLLELCYYIHLNPKNAHMIDEIDDYLWSSHLAYIGKDDFPWVTIEYVNSILKKHSENKKDFYQIFIRNKEKFLDTIQYCKFELDGNLTITNSINEKMKQHSFFYLNHLSILDISNVICKNMKLSIDELLSEQQSHKIIFARSVIAYFCHYYANHYMKDIAAFFLRTPDGVSRTMHRQLKLGHIKHTTKILFTTIEDDLKKYIFNPRES